MCAIGFPGDAGSRRRSRDGHIHWCEHFEHEILHSTGAATNTGTSANTHDSLSWRNHITFSCCGLCVVVSAQDCVLELTKRFPHIDSEEARKTLLAHGGAVGLEEAIAYMTL